MYNKEVERDRPTYGGSSILDLSKLCMIDFHYHVIEKEFKNRYNLIYSDTDSLVYRIEPSDNYEWIEENRSYFDLSDSLKPDLKTIGIKRFEASLKTK